jgi:Class II flagellar assembly regulator
MRVDQKPSLPPPAASGAGRRGPAGQRFAVAENGAGTAAGVASAAPLATMDAILALQGEGEGDAGERRRRSMQRGNDLLDSLDRLKAALLSGRVSVADLQAIAARLAERREASGDPRLDDLLLHIELRAQVEMAKLGIH